MFRPHNTVSILPEVGLISSGYNILVNGDDPILYTGNNIYGNRILGVIIGENDEETGVSYFHLIIEPNQYLNFVNRKITLLELMKRLGSVFVIEKTYSNKIIGNSLVQFDEIPKKYLPLEHSYCPSYALERTLHFGFSLKGGDADLHRATTDDVSTIQDASSEALLSAFKMIDKLSYEPEIFLQGYKASSFRIDMSIGLRKINAQQTNLLGEEATEEEISDYVSSYVAFVLGNLPTVGENSPEYQSLKEKLVSIYKTERFSTDDLELKLNSGLMKTVERLEPIREKLNRHFTQIEVVNYNSNGIEQSIGLINDDYFEKVKTSSFLDAQIYEHTLEARAIKDLLEREYTILVYQFNTKSGIGKINIQHPDGRNDLKVSLHVTSDNVNDFSGTIFTKSEHEHISIKVNGYATRQNDKIIKLDVEYKNKQQNLLSTKNLLE